MSAVQGAQMVMQPDPSIQAEGAPEYAELRWDRSSRHSACGETRRGTLTDPTRVTAPATAKSTERGGCRMSDSLQISGP
ncbi:hypothetical protein B1R27_32270 [Streptomyces sp. GKU 895]|nr:hypothetical protein B1R27_32270 [Streptomyces sp. GKU 895]